MAAFAAVYFYFVYPNRSASLLTEWREAFVGSGGLLFSLVGLAENVCQLLFPNHPWFLLVTSHLLAAFCGWGLVRAVGQSLRSETRAQHILLVSLPIAVAVVASACRQYPLLIYPRFILWILPICCVLMLYGLESVLTHGSRCSQLRSISPIAKAFVPIFCVLFLLANYWYLRTNPTRTEEVREAVLYLKEHAASSAPLFITGADTEQFAFYSRLVRWFPTDLYVANAWWPCRSRNKIARVSDPLARNIHEDLHDFVLRTGSGDVWLLLPYGSPGDWDYGTRKEVEEVPKLMEFDGCRGVNRREFEDAIVYRFSCTPRQKAMEVAPNFHFPG